MITFLVKSTVCMILLYGFYHFFLRHHKILIFNRFYLVSSLVFSMIIPDDQFYVKAKQDPLSVLNVVQAKLVKLSDMLIIQSIKNFAANLS